VISPFSGYATLIAGSIENGTYDISVFEFIEPSLD